MIRIRPTIPRNAWRANAFVRQWNQTRPAGTTAGRKRKDEYWTAEKLSIKHQYPLSVAVADAIHPHDEVATKLKKTKNAGKRELIGGVHVRTQIVSPDLCDDVLKYADHTLNKHKGCDILDINPGAGLWSQKLHKYLQPRSHVLLEPRYDKFEEFLDPLLTAPGSRYSLAAGDPTALQTYRDLITNGVFPHQTVLDADDPRAQEPNNTLLVTGSLVWDPRLPGLGFDSMAKQLAYHFATAAWTNDLFHAFGLVRTLLWVQAEDFSPMVADTVSSMQKTTRIMEMTQNTNVFVAPERPPRSVGRGSPGRDPQYEIESTVRALRRGREHGIELPPHRRADIHDFAEDIEQTSNGTGISSHSEMHNYLREQQLAGKNTVGLLSEGLIDHLEERKYIAKKYPEINLDPDPKTKKRQKPPPDHPHGAQISKFFKNIALTNLAFRNKALASSVADIGEKIYNLECKILRMKDGRRKDSAMAKLDELNKKWNHGVESQNTNYSKASATEVDDRNAIRSPPCPLLGWDDRPFEPIVMRNDEVWPRNRLSLISGEPIPRPLDDSSDFHEWVTDFVFGLYSTPSDAVNHALDKMQHGLSDIINECPSLKDPERGGRLQMEHLRVRMLTNEMIIELVKAYKNWPFKEPGSDQATYFKNKYQGHAIPGGGA